MHLKMSTQCQPIFSRPQCIDFHSMCCLSLLSAYPTWFSVSWADGSLTVPTGVQLNLTCHAWLSRPPATLTWSKGSHDVTDDVVHSTMSEGHNGMWCIHNLLLCVLVNIQHQGAVSIRKTVLPGMAIPMLKIRRPNGRLIFNMEIAIRR